MEKRISIITRFEFQARDVIETIMERNLEGQPIVIQEVLPGMNLSATVIAKNGSERYAVTFPVQIGRIENGIATVIDFGPPRRTLQLPVDQIKTGTINECLKLDLAEPGENPYPRVK